MFIKQREGRKDAGHLSLWPGQHQGELEQGVLCARPAEVETSLNNF